MIRRLFVGSILVCIWLVAMDWGYHHAVTLRVARIHAQRQAVIDARDMQRMRDVSQIRACQTRVMMDDLHMGTDIMIAHSALKQAGMEK